MTDTHISHNLGRCNSECPWCVSQLQPRDLTSGVFWYSELSRKESDESRTDRRRSR